MSEPIHNPISSSERNERRDALEQLLAKDAQTYPVQDAPWFATRAAALAREIPQQGRGFLLSAVSLRLRWLLPIPLAGIAAFALLVMQHAAPSASHLGAFNSSESEFEQHIEMVTSGDSAQDYLVSQ